MNFIHHTSTFISMYSTPEARAFLIPLLVLLLSPVFLVAQSSDRLSGQVVDVASQQGLASATILVAGTTIGSATDADGQFRLPVLQSGTYTLVVRSLGYLPQQVIISIPQDLQEPLQIELRRSVLDFDEVIITSSPTGSGVRYQPDRAFSGDELNRRRDVTIGQMLDGEPGVAMRSFGAAPARPVIRGLDGERILVLENGQRMGDLSESAADHAISLDPQAAERIEVIRGPASLLYGTSALGGVINMITTDIPHDWSIGTFGDVSLSGSTVNSMGSAFGRIGKGWDNQAISGRFSFRDAGNINTPQGVLEDTGLRNYDGSIGYGFRSGNTLGGISLMGVNSVYEIPEAIDDPNERVEIRYHRLAMQTRLDFQHEGFFDRTQVRLNAARFFQQEVEVEFEPGRIINEDIDLEYSMYMVGATATFQHRPAAIFDRGVVGLNINARVLDVGGDEQYTPGDQYINTALFTFQEIPVRSDLRLQAGARLDHRFLEARPNDLYPDIDERKHDLNVAASFGLNYRPSSAVEVGLQFARAHRYPTSEELFSDGAHLGAGAYEVGDPTLKTEIGYGTDLFLRYQRGRLQFEAAGFVNFINGFVVFQPTGQIDAASGFPIFEYQGADARLFGGELSAAVSVTNNLIVTGGADYVNAARRGGSNDPLPQIPPLRLRIGAEQQVGRYWGGFTLRHVFAQDLVAPEEDITDGYTLLNLQAGYRFDVRGLHRIVLRLENVFDTTYRDHLSRVEDREFPMPGRNLSVVYSWSF